MRRVLFTLATGLATCFASAAMADVTVDTSTIHDFFAAHKDAPVVTQSLRGRQVGVITSVGQDYFCEKPAGAQDTAGWCVNFAKITYFKFDGHSVIFSFEAAW
ncbi:MAG: hypothetical protein ACYC9P_05300 [Rudaea sp.]